MIVTRSPLRISLGGGGTDIPSYYEKNEGFLVAAAIQQYIYVSVHKTFIEDFILKYSEIERVRKVDEIRHPIVREALKMFDVDIHSLEISSFADIPAGTGLGSSGVFGCALLKSICEHKKIELGKTQLAESACAIEIEKLKEPSGKQDQYISVFGGIKAFTFQRNGSVKVEPLYLSDSTQFDLEDSLIMFFTGYSRRSSRILSEQDMKTKKSDRDMIENLNLVKEIGYKSFNSLKTANFQEFGTLMHEHWVIKKARSKQMANNIITKAYETAIKSGAIGGKLVGAGGGGFLLFVTEDKKRTRKALTDFGLKEVPIRFDFTGTSTIIGKGQGHSG